MQKLGKDGENIRGSGRWVRGAWRHCRLLGEIGPVDPLRTVGFHVQETLMIDIHRRPDRPGEHLKP